MVILPDVGLHLYYQQLAIRFAEAGFRAFAIDYFGRSNGVSKRGDDFDWQSEIAEVTPEQVAADVGAAASFLQTANPGPCSRLALASVVDNRGAWLRVIYR